MNGSAAWQQFEAGFLSSGERLFYRAWQPAQDRPTSERRALIFLHRGHEHSGRISPLVEQLGYQQDWAFAWDARGHGHSPGARGDAPSFMQLVQDLDEFVRHISATYQIAPENMLLIANSVGAVVASTWLHDYAVPVRGIVMAAAAFDINLYVPLAKPALRLAIGFKPDLFVKSYIRSSMLTHCPKQAALYDADPLIAKAISARILLELADTAKRIVQDAHVIQTPTLMLVAGRDYVVKAAPQQQYFQRLSAQLKRLVVVPESFHAILYEADMSLTLRVIHEFIADCYAKAPQNAEQVLKQSAELQRSLEHFEKPLSAVAAPKLGLAKQLFYGAQRLLLNSLGRLSVGMQIGLTHGFDSGKSLDYVYKNQPQGRLVLGKILDQGYLQAVGWRGIRQRKTDLQQALIALIEQHPKEQPLRILDIATGSGRYVLEILKRYQDREIQATLRDFLPQNLADAEQLAQSLALKQSVTFEVRDAFSLASYPASAEPFDIVIVSGLYELFSDNHLIAKSLAGIRQQIAQGGHLVYTGQPWHPQLELIANTLNNHRGEMWVMRPRPQAEMDALVNEAGGRKVKTYIGIDGIFTVSVARFGCAKLA
jgi:alpha-beta hydrolase superfamily lysophospholipase/SAM-dependent methyltransferase